MKPIEKARYVPTKRYNVRYCDNFDITGDIQIQMSLWERIIFVFSKRIVNKKLILLKLKSGYLQKYKRVK